MKAIKTFLIGSSYFFSSFPDYHRKDLDELHIMDAFPEGVNVLHLFKGERDILLTRNMTKEEFIADALCSGVPMRAGKFLVREFAMSIGMTIGDLMLLKPCFDAMDDLHKYEKVIYNAYLENRGWWLTDKQLDDAYEVYKKHRFVQ